MTPKSRRDARLRIGALFLLDTLFLVAGLLALRGRLEFLALVVVLGAVVAIGFNLVLLVRSRTTEATWAPGSGARQLTASFEYLGVSSKVPVVIWKTVGGAAIAVNLVALVVSS